MHTAKRWLQPSRSSHWLVGPRPPTVLPTDLDIEWDAVFRERCNVLLEGPASPTAEMLSAMRPHLRPPIWEYIPSGAAVPQPQEGTLILLEVARLSTSQQAELLRWLDDGPGRSVQIVSTSSEPLFPFVETRTFDADLYYRLNVVLIQLFGTGQPDSLPAPPAER